MTSTWPEMLFQELAVQYIVYDDDAQESDNDEDDYREDENLLLDGMTDDEDYEEFSDEDDTVPQHSLDPFSPSFSPSSARS